MNPPQIQGAWVKNLQFLSCPKAILYHSEVYSGDKFLSSLFSLVNSQLNYITESPCTLAEMCDRFLPMDMSTSDVWMNHYMERIWVLNDNMERKGLFGSTNLRRTVS